MFSNDDINDLVGKEIDFTQLNGERAKLYYVEGGNRFQLGEIVFKVKYCGNKHEKIFDSVNIDECSEPKSKMLLDEVIVACSSGEFWFVGTDGHIWLEFGDEAPEDWGEDSTFFFRWKFKDSDDIIKIKNLIKK